MLSIGSPVVIKRAYHTIPYHSDTRANDWWIFNFSIVGDVNVSYSFDFGDDSYVLSTCPNVTHVYTRVGYFHVQASARNNISGPILASMWVFIQSSTGLVSLEYPQGIIEAENDTEIVLTVSQGTWMKATWITSPPSSNIIFNISGKDLTK